MQVLKAPNTTCPYILPRSLKITIPKSGNYLHFSFAFNIFQGISIRLRPNDYALFFQFIFNFNFFQ